MAAIELLLSQARRHCFSSALVRGCSSPKFSSPWLRRSLCSSSPSSQPDPNPPPNENNWNRPQPLSVQPVSYPIKPKDPSPAQEPASHERSDASMHNPQPQGNVEARGWSREDVRFVKDLSSLPAVSYPKRVAPLPEDKMQDADGEVERTNEEMEAERMKIEAENRVMRRVFRVEEQKVPFPSLIKVEQPQKSKGQKVVHDLKEAVQLVKANAKRNFDETLEAHVKLAVDLRRTDLKLTGSLSLPHGSGKALRVAVFAEGAAADEARAAGADMVGGDDLIQSIKNGSINIKEIDKCIAIPQLMPRIGKEISKKLNRLTPNARDGSVTTDVSRAVKEAKKNINFKKDKSAIVHVGLGKHCGVTMFLTRVFGRRLFATATSQTSAAGAATVRTAHNPLEEFFEADRNPEEDKPVVYGRSWKATELRNKSWEDLQKLWYVLLKEKNMLMTQRQMLHAQNLHFPNPERLPKVRKSMCRIKHVMTERAIEDPDPRRTAEMKRMINAL